jgi:hypothetical protein
MESRINTITSMKFTYFTMDIRIFQKIICGFTLCFALNIFGITPISAKGTGIFTEKQLFSLLKTSSFDNALTTGTELKIIYQRNKKIIVYYTNVGPQTGHQNDGIIIFSEGKYHHNYYINWSCHCEVKGHDLICQSYDFPNIAERVSLFDVFAARELLIGGGIERPWHGSHQIYR